ncbi:gluzincin family metallopeptidase [Pseudothermotoga lettingae]|uniref:Uncharacterized protein n=1 Tax=Pseudothermotoga lettingae (strain ATCC BAA-301 / DSM 14385 / NBRC 107922 / TMO) TaxID=416591 RepID=A8F719_PSELT|nr:hypothetical protein [Pseudothermotoga lettingae]ABV33953.1 hypothetical protein Tlet_1396 [Pseudothermotoga lettingae TMO]GLI49110.1 hypothetical protein PLETTINGATMO_12790 [Pseudothermotoga lettingae TMO]
MKKFVFAILMACSLAIGMGKFKMIKTLWVDIAFEEGLERQAFLLAQEADKIYSKLSEEFNLHLAKRPTVYLIDKTDISNGFANPLNNVIVIYPNDIDPYILTPNYKNWVTFCFTHELAHLFISNNFADYFSPLKIFGHAVPASLQSILIPMYLHEGLATYFETYITGTGRASDTLFENYMDVAKSSDVGVRYASSINSRRWLAGGPSYVQGLSLLKYIETKHGHDAVMKLFEKISQNPLSGFYRSLKTVLSDREIKDWLSIKNYSTKGEKLSETLLSISKLDLNAWRIYYAARKYNGEEAIYYYDTFAEENVKLIDVDNVISFAVNRTRLIAIARYANENGSSISKLYLYSGSVKDLQITGIVDIAWMNDFELAMIRQQNGQRTIEVYDLRNRETRKILEPKENLIPLQITASEDKIIFTAKTQNQVDLFMIDKEAHIMNLTNNIFTEVSPKLISNSLYFCADYSGKFTPYLLDIENGKLLEISATDAISSLILYDKIYYFKAVPGGFSLFRQDKVLDHEIHLSFKEFSPEPLKSVILDEEQYFYDSIKPRFVLPFPYFSPSLEGTDYGLGVAAGFWDDLMDNYAIFGFIWSWENWAAKLLLNSGKDALFSIQFDQKDQQFSLRTELDVPFRINKSTVSEKVDLIAGIEINETLSLTPDLQVIYTTGSVGGKLHQQSFPDLALWISALPDFRIGFSKAFLIKDFLLQLFGQAAKEFVQYGAHVVIPGPLLNIGTVDGFCATDSINFSAGFSNTLSAKENSYKIWFRSVFNSHIAYQIPLPIFVEIGLQSDQGYIKIGLEDILSEFLGMKNH